MKRREIVELNMEGNYVKTYKNQKEVSMQKGVHQSTISMYLSGKMKPRGNYKLMYKEDYENIYGETKAEEKKEKIVKPTSKEYYVNVLVGLANQTLVDGATYEINGTKMVYSKEKDSLLVGNKEIYTRTSMYSEVSIELPLLSPKEKAFLGQLIKAFSRISGIRKCSSPNKGFEFIRIETGVREDIVLPDFKEGKYYGNLKQDVLYSVEDLGLTGSESNEK